MNTRSKKKIQQKSLDFPISKKVLTFIGSILGIITACITIYTFSSKSSAQSLSNTNKLNSTSAFNMIYKVLLQEGTTSSSSTDSSTSTADETTQTTTSSSTAISEVSSSPTNSFSTGTSSETSSTTTSSAGK